MRTSKKIRTVCVWSLIGIAVGATQAAEVGPDNGHLILAGGAVKDLAIYQRFLDLAGGPEAPIVVIPTAGDAERYDRYWAGLRQLEQLGAKHLTLLHTRDPEVAETAEFVAPIRDARGVWFSGGRQWRLADAYLNTRTHRELRALLARGGVIGGSSAGATIQGSYLARGDTKTNTIMMGDHEEGFAFLRNVAVDQHLLRRNRQFDLIEIVEAHREVLGVGIDENTAIVVEGDRLEVIGQSLVAIYDHGRLLRGRGRFYFLAPGDRFDLKTRQATRLAPSNEPFDVVVEEPWPGR